MKPVLQFIRFKRKYLGAMFANALVSRRPAAPEKVCFVTHKKTIDWILSAKCRKLSAEMDSATEVVYTKDFRNLPHRQYYFFAHYKYFASSLRRNPHIWKSRKAVLFTHPSITRSMGFDHIAWVLNKADIVICLNRDIVKTLIKSGVDEAKIIIQHMAADPDMFQPHIRGTGKVGFCMAYYPRKNPDLLFEIVRRMPDEEFLLIGRDWHEYQKYSELMAMPNLTYYDNVSYERYPELYDQIDILVSTSYLEGGPVPLLEAMLSNMIPVVSNTGFCSD
ncbi:MAG: glycosyltransferase, partial [Gammaproteobacteria bacterium]